MASVAVGVVKSNEMSSVSVGVVKPKESKIASIQGYIDREIDDLLASLRNPGQLSAEERRGIIARYTAVLEGNFIYWMTGAYISVGSDEARAKIMDNLREEVRDCHPGMMRRFAIAAHAIPTDADAESIHRNLMDVRLFIGRLSAVPIVVTMAFFEGFIQRFMAYLAELAQRQGSAEMEYTDVHGVCDITHTQELFRALEAEMALAQPLPEKEMYEGVELLRTLIQSIVVNTHVQ
jgi:heme oxygenase-like protein